MTADFKERTIQELLAGLRAGDFSSRELTSYFLNRIETLEGQVHAFLSIKPDYALRTSGPGGCSCLLEHGAQKKALRSRLCWGSPLLSKMCCVWMAFPAPAVRAFWKISTRLSTPRLSSVCWMRVW